MKSCREFQHILDRKGRYDAARAGSAGGELPADDEEALAEHLLTCPECQAYARAAERSREILSRHERPPSWDMVLARVYSVERRYRRAAVRVGLGAIVLAGAGIGLESARLLRFAAGMAVLVIGYLLLVQMRARQIARLGSIERDLLKEYRSNLIDSIASMTMAAAFCGLSAAGWFALGLYFRGEALAAGLCFIGLAVYCWTRAVRLKAELSALR